MTLEEQLYDLLAKFHESGKVVTISQQPLYPLAMGHYFTEVQTRPLREGHHTMIVSMNCDNAQGAGMFVQHRLDL